MIRNDKMNDITFSDILIEPQYSEIESRSDVKLTSYIGGIEMMLPVISANMKHITGPKMAYEMYKNGGFGILHRFNDTNEAVKEFKEASLMINDADYFDECNLLDPFDYKNKDVIIDNPEIEPNNDVGVSIGVQDGDKKRFSALYEAGARVFVIDIAHGHCKAMKDMIEFVRDYPELTIICGNIATAEAGRDLQEWGADCVKVGIGPGSACLTRKNAGVGVSQFTALQNVYNAVDIPIISDGGMTSPGDVAKALIFSDAVMTASLVAGTSETPGPVFRNDKNEFYKVYGGSASGENKVSNGKQNRFIEGVMKIVPFIGEVKYILREIKDGLQSTCSYTGVEALSNFRNKVKWRIISSASQRESKL